MRIVIHLIAILGLFVQLCPGEAPPRNDFYLKDGDRVVFYGDSITDQRLYTTFTETYVLTRFPTMHVGFVHSGVAGDNVLGGAGGAIDLRLSRDVFAYRPTVMTIMLGMNDGSYRAFDRKIFDTYVAGYRHIIQSVKTAEPKIRITLIAPSPYDDVTRPPGFEGGYNAVLMQYCDFVKRLAAAEELTLADMNSPVVATLRAMQARDPEPARTIIPDRVHPSRGGHLLMAEALLKSWKAPALVTAVHIDAAGSQIVNAENTRVTALNTNGTISWVQADTALPMPLDVSDAGIALALRYSDFEEALNRESLCVSGLTAERYALEIDGERAGIFSREEMAAGLNLATLTTPMSKQAARVHDFTLRHNLVHFARWRLLQLNLRDMHVVHEQAAAEALDLVEDEVVQQQRAAAEPKDHRYALIPQ